MDTAVRDQIHCILLIILFLILVSFRIIFFTQAENYPGFANYIEPDDQHYYHTTACAIADGNLLGHKGPLIRSPGYVYFTGFLYSISGQNTKFVLAVQSLLGVLTGLMVYLIGKLVFNRLTGLYASFFYAFYLPVLCYESALLMCPLITFLITSGFFFYVKAQNECRNKFFLLSGLALGWAFICRPNNLVMAIILLIFLLRSKKDKGLKPVYLFAAGFFIFYGLVMIRNIFAGVNPFSITTQGQLVLISGHAHDSTGVGWFRSKNELLILSDNIFTYFKNILAEIFSNFPVWLKLQLKKCYAYFFNYEYPQFIDFYIMRQTIPFLNIPSVSFGVISPLALLAAGLIIKKRGAFKKTANLLVYYSFGLFVSVVVFYVIARFRQPAVPFLCVLSGFCLYELKRRKNRLKYISIIIVLVIFLNYPPIIKKAHGDFSAISTYNRGILYISKDMYVKAASDLEYVISINKKSGHTAFLLGVMYEKQKLYKTALKWLYRALELGNEPNKGYLLSYIGKCHAERSEYDKAVWFLKKSTQYDSSEINVLLMLAECYTKLNQINESIAVFKDITKKYPSDYRAFYRLSNYYTKQKDSDSAQFYLNRAYELNPKLSIEKNLIELKK